MPNQCMPPLVRVIVACCPCGRCSEGRARAEPWPDGILGAVALGAVVLGEILGLDIDAGSH